MYALIEIVAYKSCWKDFFFQLKVILKMSLFLTQVKFWAIDYRLIVLVLRPVRVEMHCLWFSELSPVEELKRCCWGDWGYDSVKWLFMRMTECPIGVFSMSVNRGVVASNIWGMNLTRYAIIPKNNCRSDLLHGEGMLVIASIFEKSGVVSFAERRCPKKESSDAQIYNYSYLDLFPIAWWFDGFIFYKG